MGAEFVTPLIGGVYTVAGTAVESAGGAVPTVDPGGRNLT
jgi:hypothetical protein